MSENYERADDEARYVVAILKELGFYEAKLGPPGATEGKAAKEVGDAVAGPIGFELETSSFDKFSLDVTKMTSFRGPGYREGEDYPNAFYILKSKQGCVVGSAQALHAWLDKHPSRLDLSYKVSRDPMRRGRWYAMTLEDMLDAGFVWGETVEQALRNWRDSRGRL